MGTAVLLLSAVLSADIPDQDLASLGFSFVPVRSWDTLSDVDRDGIPQPPTDKGAVIHKVLKNSAAERAGIVALDIVTSLDGKGVDKPEEFQEQVKALRVGEPLKIEFYRALKKDGAFVWEKLFKMISPLTRRETYSTNK